MPRVYCDNTFYDSIAKRRSGFAPKDVDEFRALSGHAIRSYFSPVNGDEILTQWASDPAGALQRLVIARDLVGFDNILKQPSDLLRDEILAYGRGLSSPPMTMARSQAELFDRELRAVAKGGPDAGPLAAQVAADVTRLKDDDKKPMVDAQREVLTAMRWVDQTPEDRASVTFEKFRADFGTALIEGYADSLGVGDKCRHRGIPALLKRRAVEFLVGAQAAWVYTVTVPQGGLETRQVDRNDGYDNWHALMAAAADIFVTGDERLAVRMKWLNIADFTVVKTLRELLDVVGTRR